MIQYKLSDFEIHRIQKSTDEWYDETNTVFWQQQIYIKHRGKLTLSVGYILEAHTDNDIIMGLLKI